MSTAGRRRKSTFLTGQDAVAPSITDTTAPAAPAPETPAPAMQQEAAPALAAEQQKGSAPLPVVRRVLRPSALGWGRWCR